MGRGPVTVLIVIARALTEKANRAREAEIGSYVGKTMVNDGDREMATTRNEIVDGGTAKVDLKALHLHPTRRHPRHRLPRTGGRISDLIVLDDGQKGVLIFPERTSFSNA